MVMNMGIHVIFSQGKWKVVREKAPKALRVFSTRRSAIDYGRKVGDSENVELYVHHTDGTLDHSKATKRNVAL